MSLASVLDVVGLFLLLGGALLCLAAAVGLLRFPDLLTRMHAGTKPQVLGVLLVLLALGLTLRTPLDLGMILLISFFQLLTIPVGGHMVARAAFRTGHAEGIVVDEPWPESEPDPASQSPSDPQPAPEPPTDPSSR